MTKQREAYDRDPDATDLVIRPDRLWQRHMDFARFGGTEDGGVCRLALTEPDLAAHRHLADIALGLGLRVQLDPVGNMYLRLEGREPDLAPVMVGSHCDSQPTGGRFDGIYGVLAGLEAIETMVEGGFVPRRPVECVIWNNEEGSRFAPGCLGSSVFAGLTPLETALAVADEEGCLLGEAVQDLFAAIPEAERRALGTPVAAFLEAHIEQGPVLEAEGRRIGVVTGVQGYRRTEVTMVGRADHSGTTPRSRRQDAFLAAMNLCCRMEQALHDDEDLLRFTVGRFAVHPNAWSVVPGKVVFGIDIRHPDTATLEHSDAVIAGLIRDRADGCAVTSRTIASSDPVTFPPLVPDLIEVAAAQRGYSARRIFSGAGHDARNMSFHCPSGMIFVPCRGGISHNSMEYAEPEDLAAGAQVLADVVWQLAEAR
ncbi:M20 family metallo-hydrolase [Halodurantibacterium flavum]|uniref:M20 family metallo-hydrolase n=1 Tax=Halodurantibacterium flavum TaxID=1382802 RepID=A0ABW4S1Y6_9RHOB